MIESTKYLAILSSQIEVKDEDKEKSTKGRWQLAQQKSMVLDDLQGDSINLQD